MKTPRMFGGSSDFPAPAPAVTGADCRSALPHRWSPVLVDLREHGAVQVTTGQRPFGAEPSGEDAASVAGNYSEDAVALGYRLGLAFGRAHGCRFGVPCGGDRLAIGHPHRVLYVNDSPKGQDNRDRRCNTDSDLSACETRGSGLRCSVALRIISTAGGRAWRVGHWAPLVPWLRAAPNRDGNVQPGQLMR